MKTLKDLGLSSMNYDEVQTEAIKWYKAAHHPSQRNTCSEAAGMQDFIQEFFNLSEEDLA